VTDEAIIALATCDLVLDAETPADILARQLVAAAENARKE
jgi:hypothetical protein